MLRSVEGSKSLLLEAIVFAGISCGKSTAQIAVGLSRTGEDWTFNFDSISPDPLTSDVHQRPFLQRTTRTGFKRSQRDRFAKQLLKMEGDGPRIDLDFDALELPKEGTNAIVVFTADLMISDDCSVVELRARQDKRFRFVPLPRGMQVKRSGDLHRAIGNCCEPCKSEKRPRDWQWLFWYQAPKRHSNQRDWSAVRKKKRRLYWFELLYLRMRQKARWGKTEPIFAMD